MKTLNELLFAALMFMSGCAVAGLQEIPVTSYAIDPGTSSEYWATDPSLTKLTDGIIYDSTTETDHYTDGKAAAWQMAIQDTGPTVTFDLGQSHEVVSVNINSLGLWYNFKSVKIYAADTDPTDSSYTLIGDYDNEFHGVGSNENAINKEIELNVSGRYFKLEFSAWTIHSSAKPWCMIAEVDFYRQADPGYIAITNQPQDVTAVAGTDAIFSIAAYGETSPLSYQWKKNGIIIENAISDTLQLKGITSDDAAEYSCIVTSTENSIGVESAFAVLTISCFGNPTDFNNDCITNILDLASFVTHWLEDHSQWQTADVVIMGSSPSGLAAAVQAARLGSSVIVVTPYKHIGGMMSAGLTRTDLGDAATTGGLASEFFKRVSAYYDRDHKPWTEQSMSFFFEPGVAEEIWWEMVNETNRIRVIDAAQLVSVTKIDDTLKSVKIKDTTNGVFYTLKGKAFIDATYEGDLAAMAGAPYRIGREAKSEFGEPHGLVVADDLLQAYCFRLCVTQNQDNFVAIQQPEGYDPDEFALLADYVVEKNITKFVTDCLFAREKVNGKADGNAQWRCWVSTDWAEINAEYPDGSYATRDEIYNEYCRLTLGWWYFLQHDPSVPEVLREDALSWGLAKDEFTDTAHLPFMLYVREARRIIGEYVFSELDATQNATKSDSIGCGGYPIDSHHVLNYDESTIHLNKPIGNVRYPVTRGYQIPFRILVPQNVKGLLVSLCVSSTHLGYCTLRMEPEYIKMGQAAGAAAHLAVENNVEPGKIDVEALQKILIQENAILSANDVQRQL